MRLRTVHGLPEFDTAAYGTVLAWERLRRGRMGRLLVVNPGQGILPVAAATPTTAWSCACVSRDLLQLRATMRALGDAGTTEVRRRATPSPPSIPAPPAVQHRASCCAADATGRQRWRPSSSRLADDVRDRSRRAGRAQPRRSPTSTRVVRRREDVVERRRGRPHHGTTVVELHATAGLTASGPALRRSTSLAG